MGGAHEDVIGGGNGPKVVDIPKSDELLQGTVKPTLKSGILPSISDQVQSIRHHVSGKDVHFHVDSENLKLAMPLAQLEVYVECLRNLSSERKMYHDSKNKTLGKFEVGLNNQGQLDIVVEIRACEEGPVVQKLDKLMTLSRKK
mgnify:CR=1 FL=1